jgi:cell division protease FtsH
MSDDRNKKPNPAGQSGDRRPDDTGPSLGASGGGFNWGWLLLLGLLFLPSIIGVFTGNRGGSVTYNQFRSQVESGNVEAVTVSGNRIQGRFSSAVTVGSGSNTNEVQQFVVHIPPFGDANLLELMRTNNVPIYTQPAQDGMSLFGVLLNILPFLLLVWIGYRMFKGMQQRGQGMFGVGQNKAKLYERSASVETTFKDVAGLQSAKQEVQEIVDFLKRPERYEKLGGKPPKGVLLVGPPGTGKTLLARAIAGEADTDFYTMSGSDFMEMFVGVGASRVRNLFKDAKKRQPSIIFIDELDSIGRHRGAGLGEIGRASCRERV